RCTLRRAWTPFTANTSLHIMSLGVVATSREASKVMLNAIGYIVFVTAVVVLMVTVLPS
ncbi:hypothetical protein LCGC14_1414310, partial [marine sediment metagenome]